LIQELSLLSEVAEEADKMAEETVQRMAWLEAPVVAEVLVFNGHE
jgi:hypothetical protein